MLGGGENAENDRRTYHQHMSVQSSGLSTKSDGFFMPYRVGGRRLAM